LALIVPASGVVDAAAAGTGAALGDGEEEPLEGEEAELAAGAD
jgi:hypothetical protein